MPNSTIAGTTNAGRARAVTRQRSAIGRDGVLPILAPALTPLGVDPVHFSIIFTHNMEIALIHPPVGLNLYVRATISSAPIGEVIRGILPFLILLLIVLMIITYWPPLTMWLPQLIYGK
jgi:C4-dicarboxylate transporter DctM subunit